jgi:hypothetical protein
LNFAHKRPQLCIHLAFFTKYVKYYGCGVKGERTSMNLYRIACSAIIGLTVLMDPAFAGVVPGPGPIAGIGLPALALIGGAYWVGRKLFDRKK